MILVGIPSYDGKLSQYTLTALLRASGNPGTIGGFSIDTSSLLTWNLNKILVNALNNDRSKVTHLAILHTDIEIEMKWIDKMKAIMDEKKADILSAVVPVRNDKGLTSVAICEEDQPGLPSHVATRLSLKECAGLGGTFTDERLIVGSDVTLIDLRGKWIEGLYFTPEDCIVKNKDGKLEARTFQADWNFSLKARARGASIWATNEIKLWHHGGGRWANQISEVK